MKPLIAVLVSGLVFAGCHQQGPVELRDSDAQNQDLQVLPLPAATAPEFSLADLDSADSFAPAATNAFAQMAVVGATCDAEDGTRCEEALAYAVFYDRNAPVLDAGRRIGYAGLDAGTLTVDDILMTKVGKRYRVGGRDSLAGVQYALVNRGHGEGRGFQYTGNHRYEWMVGGGIVPGFRTTITSPAELKLTGNGSRTISLSRTWKVTWAGRPERVRIVISDAASSGGPSRPLLHLQTRSPRNGVAIPSSLLEVLRGRSLVRVAFMTETSRTEAIPGYPDPLVLKAVSIHSVIMRISR
jgi:hypothetical protein